MLGKFEGFMDFIPSGCKINPTNRREDSRMRKIKPDIEMFKLITNLSLVFILISILYNFNLWIFFFMIYFIKLGALFFKISKIFQNKLKISKKRFFYFIYSSAIF